MAAPVRPAPTLRHSLRSIARTLIAIFVTGDEAPWLLQEELPRVMAKRPRVSRAVLTSMGGVHHLELPQQRVATRQSILAAIAFEAVLLDDVTVGSARPNGVTGCAAWVARGGR